MSCKQSKQNPIKTAILIPARRSHRLTRFLHATLKKRHKTECLPPERFIVGELLSNEDGCFCNVVLIASKWCRTMIGLINYLHAKEVRKKINMELKQSTKLETETHLNHPPPCSVQFLTKCCRSQRWFLPGWKNLHADASPPKQKKNGTTNWFHIRHM